jgi:hypothetical protein
MAGLVDILKNLHHHHCWDTLSKYAHIQTVCKKIHRISNYYHQYTYQCRLLKLHLTLSYGEGWVRSDNSYSRVRLVGAT